MKKALRETQTLRTGCSKAEPKKIAPPQTPSRGAGRPKFNQREMVTTFTYKLVWLGSMHAISSYRGNRPKKKHTHKHTHRQDRLQYTTPQLASAQCNDVSLIWDATFSPSVWTSDGTVCSSSMPLTDKVPV